MRPTEPPRLLTSGLIAAELGAPLSSVLHVLRTRPHIRPAAMVGRVRVYDRHAMDLVRRELAVRRGAAPPG